MPLRRLIAVAAVLVLVAGLAAATYLAQSACPPPDWAFWRYTDGSEAGRVNFGCVADG